VSAVRVHVDWTRCDGDGACAELLPELLESDEWGYPLGITGERDPTVPRALERHARRAVSTCPLQALRLVTDQAVG
jgi:ferredoxin